MKKFSSILSGFTLLAICICNFTKCSKEFSYEGGNIQPSTPVASPPTAAIASFTLNGSPASCINASTTGNYIAGVKLSSANTIIIEVNVVSIGAYTIKTDTLDGISFSTSGSFTSTGKHTVTLAGFGTPEQPAILTFTPSATTSACTIKVTVQNAEPLATYVLESGAGNPNPCVYTLSGNYIAHTPLSNSNSISMRVYVTVPGNFTIATEAKNGITFYYSGTFTAAGTQYVVLKGTGTPLSSGTYSFTPEIVGPHPLGGQSCSVNVVVE